MDTLATLKIDSDSESVLEECKKELMELDSMLSRHNENGSVYAYNISENGEELCEKAKELLLLAESVKEKTDGCFSAFSGALTELWSNSKTYPDEQKLKEAVDSATENAEFDGQLLKKSNKSTMLEFGGIAKGYACDRAVELLKSKGVQSGIITFSSSIGVFGTNPSGNEWKIAIKDPFDPEEIYCYVMLASGGLSVSGDYERYYEIDGKKYNHIIDVKSGLPVDNGVRSVVVACESAAEADALSTAFFVMGVDEVSKKYSQSEEIKYMFITDDGVYMNDSMKETVVYS
jgi:thiamine biosynthesis lipoprotein